MSPEAGTEVDIGKTIIEAAMQVKEKEMLKEELLKAVPTLKEDTEEDIAEEADMKEETTINQEVNIEANTEEAEVETEEKADTEEKVDTEEITTVVEMNQAPTRTSKR